MTTARTPDGRLITPHDLDHLAGPTTRWHARNKKMALDLARLGVCSKAEIMERCRISDDEWAAWERDYGRFGTAGLQCRALRYTRAEPRKPGDEEPWSRQA